MTDFFFGVASLQGVTTKQSPYSMLSHRFRVASCLAMMQFSKHNLSSIFHCIWKMLTSRDDISFLALRHCEEERRSNLLTQCYPIALRLLRASQWRSFRSINLSSIFHCIWKMLTSREGQKETEHYLTCVIARRNDEAISLLNVIPSL